MFCLHFISHLYCNFFLRYMLIKDQIYESINFSHTELAKTDMHYLYRYITCSVLLTFYFSSMLQIISEIYFDSRDSNLWDQFFSHMESVRIRTNMHHLYNIQCFAYILFLTYVANDFWDIYFDCTFKSMRSIIFFPYGISENGYTLPV